MKTQTYESVIIVNAALDDTQIEAVSKRVEATISTDGGNILDIEKWGRKRLAYPIQKSKNGYYIIYRFTAPTEAISKIERMYRLDESIVRYLTTVMELKDLANFEKLKQDRKAEVLNAQQVNDSTADDTEASAEEDANTVDETEAAVETKESAVTDDENLSED